MTEPPPIVSIVIPVYNGAAYLERTLGSIMAQTYPHFEVMLVDDSSIDGSFALMQQYAEQDGRFQAHRKPNQGSAVKGIAYALPLLTGSYFFYMSQDDIISADCLERMVDVMAQDERIDAVLPDMLWWDGSQGPNANQRAIRAPHGDYQTQLTGKEAFIQSLSWLIHGFSLRKVDLVRQIGYETELANGDEYTTRHYYTRCQRVAFCAGVFYYHQGNPQAMTKQLTSARFDWIKTELRLTELIEQQSLPKVVLQAQLTSASKTYRRLRRQYQQNKAHFSREASKIEELLIQSRMELLRLLRRNAMWGSYVRLRVKYSL